MGWNLLTNVDEIERIVDASRLRPQLIFKHSTRCGISAGAKMRLEGGLEALGERFDLHFLDLLSYRDVSNAVAQTLGVYHQSPQVIVLEGGEVSFDTSHGSISPDYILKNTVS